MKNLFAKTLIIFTVVLVFTSCKKDKSDNPENTIDITKYVVVGKITVTGDFGHPIVPYILTFDNNGGCSHEDLNGTINGTYTYKDGMLKVTLKYASTSKTTDYKIENKYIVSNTSDDADYRSQLVEIPSSNELLVNTYKGVWNAYSNNSGRSAIFKFTETQYGEGEFNTSVPNIAYTSIKNLAARSTKSGVISFWVLIDGRLAGSRFDVNTNSLWWTGTFTKQ